MIRSLSPLRPIVPKVSSQTSGDAGPSSKVDTTAYALKGQLLSRMVENTQLGIAHLMPQGSERRRNIIKDVNDARFGRDSAKLLKTITAGNARATQHYADHGAGNLETLEAAERLTAAGDNQFEKSVLGAVDFHAHSGDLKERWKSQEFRDKALKAAIEAGSSPENDSRITEYLKNGANATPFVGQLLKRDGVEDVKMMRALTKDGLADVNAKEEGATFGDIAFLNYRFKMLHVLRKAPNFDIDTLVSEAAKTFVKRHMFLDMVREGENAKAEEFLRNLPANQRLEESHEFFKFALNETLHPRTEDLKGLNGLLGLEISTNPQYRDRVARRLYEDISQIQLAEELRQRSISNKGIVPSSMGKADAQRLKDLQTALKTLLGQSSFRWPERGEMTLTHLRQAAVYAPPRTHRPAFSMLGQPGI